MILILLTHFRFVEYNIILPVGIFFFTLFNR